MICTSSVQFEINLNNLKESVHFNVLTLEYKNYIIKITCMRRVQKVRTVWILKIMISCSMVRTQDLQFC